jgi:putative SOS response-associated peptidase YedK
VNADDHPVMSHFHRHGEEKRMPVILHPDDYDRWLNAAPEEAFRMCQSYPAELMQSAPAPKPPRKSTKTVLPPPDESPGAEND